VDAALALGLWPAGVQLIWQTGAGTYDRFASREDHGRVLIRPFLDPVAEAYAAADLVVARAGAMTIAELCAWGLPAILIPLPTAAAGHQLTNARALADANAALLLEQRFATGKKLSETIVSLLSYPARMADIASAVRVRAHPDAADVIAASALRVLSQA
jgi:UDP-N-acetylglucosamine--N-acetylmuramyl-(pentapeptide) pyrophosphoryl-undecaprenol N-acetylglucosamine transferase